MRRRGVVVLGATGSIGRSAQEVLAAYPDHFHTVGLAADTSAEAVSAAAERLEADWVCCCNAQAEKELKSLTRRAKSYGDLAELIAAPEVDVVLCAIVGTAGLPLVIAALEAGKTVALASKEVLVMAGELVMSLPRSGKGRIVPVDSEHSALFQCLAGRDAGEVERLIITASGGALRNASRAELEAATPEQALAHPTWSMGRKVTIDSATLMNKALEFIEAGYLFGFPAERIKVVVHPQSVVHSLVELIDGSLIAQLSVPDMRFAIGYALSYPERLDGAGLPRTDFGALALEFFEVDRARFPAIDFAEEALRLGGTMPAVLNAANEVAVERFISGKIRLGGIWKIVESTMARHTVAPLSSLEAAYIADREAREFALRCDG